MNSLRRQEQLDDAESLVEARQALEAASNNGSGTGDNDGSGADDAAIAAARSKLKSALSRVQPQHTPRQNLRQAQGWLIVLQNGVRQIGRNVFAVTIGLSPFKAVLKAGVYTRHALRTHSDERFLIPRPWSNCTPLWVGLSTSLHFWPCIGNQVRRSSRKSATGTSAKIPRKQASRCWTVFSRNALLNSRDARLMRMSALFCGTARACAGFVRVSATCGEVSGYKDASACLRWSCSSATT